MPLSKEQYRENHRVGIALKVYEALLQQFLLKEIDAASMAPVAAEAAVIYADALIAELEKSK